MSQYSHLYKTKRWQRLRAAHLAGEPLCVMCKERGRIEPARVADHIRPHRGDMTLFLDPTNLQSLCFVHHNKDKQEEDIAALKFRPNPTLYVCIGAPASGKSTWAESMGDVAWFHIDTGRGRYQDSREHWRRARKAMLARLRRSHDEKREIVVDTTAVGKLFRMQVRYIAAQLGRPCCAVIWDEPLSLIKARNAVRVDAVPEPILEKVHRQIRATKQAILAEPWHAVIRMDRDGERQVLLDHESNPIGVDESGYKLDGSW